jgi:hypothetical protein
MLHLCKLSVGVRDVAQLRERQAGSHSPYHQTRNFPRRHAEILAGGSIYWVISGVMQVRQQILDICQDQWDDGSACAKLVLSPELISVAGRHMRPFQGWRYLEKNDAPNDVSANDGIVGESALPEALRYDLRALCLL